MMNRRKSELGSHQTGGRAGFTLIELLVSVALAVIVLGMFAALYRWTTQIYSEQKGNRRNDQRARMLVTVLNADLDRRTFRDVVPFVPGQNTSTAPAYDPQTGKGFSSERRAGYFSISENDPDNGTDDVLAFTVKIPEESGEAPFSGRATVLFDPNAADPHNMGNPYPNDPAGWQHYMEDRPNQPEFDDGIPARNNSGISRFAEIAYFLRNGKLYRRVLLIREIYSDPGGIGGQPREVTGNYNTTIAPAGSGLFWRDFDYSAWYKFSGTGTGLKFHDSARSLVNENPPASTPVDADLGFPPVLGIPMLRFGNSFNRFSTFGRPIPREYVDSGSSRRFIGRFLVEETAHADFGYPGATSAANDPHTRTDLTYDAKSGLVTQYKAADPRPRRGEDILMTNVHEFDIKVWDDGLGRFVDLGHQQQNAAGTNGFYHRANNLRDPNLAAGNFDWNRFDTWHPFGVTGNSNSGLKQPPYKAGGINAALGSTAERPLRAIQITIRFFDVPTQKMRQLTIVHRLN